MGRWLDPGNELPGYIQGVPTARIDARVDVMLDRGLADEVRGLIERGYSCDLPSMTGIGYRQICQHMAGELTLDAAVARIKTRTHRFARMQYNWLRRDDQRLHWIDIVTTDPYPEACRVVESEPWT